MNSGTLVKLVLIALVLMLSALPAFANEITVGSTCTLAQAINEANGAAQPEGVTCADGNDATGATGHDTIVIPSGHGTITLSSPLPTLTSHITIQGDNKVISGGDSTHLFVTGSGAHVTLRGLILANGHTDDGAGAIDHKAGSLFLVSVVVRNNEVDRDDTSSDGVGAILSASDLSITGSKIHSNGGYKQSGDVPSSIKHIAGDLTIDSTVFRNDSGSSVISAAVTGTATVTIRNSTFFAGDTQVNGQPSPALLIKGAGVTSHVYHITSSTDGIAFGAGTHHLRNSILYGAPSDCALVDSGTLTSNENNIIGNNNCGGSPSSADPLLPDTGGGGTVPTFLALPANSPAINAAGDCTPYTTTSHNGVTRPSPVGGACDIGSFEVEQSEPPPVARFTATVDRNNRLTYRFDASGSSGSNLAYTWNFSDGFSSTAVSFDYTFCCPTVHTINLKVANNSGSHTISRELDVGAAPPRPDRRDSNRGDSDDSGGSSSSSSDTASDDDQAPAQLIIPTCLSLPDHISVYNITHLTQCQQVDSSGIGNAAVLGLGFRDGVDVWGWVLHNTQVCFEGSSGSFRFLDAATAPRAVSELPVVGRDGMICATIDRAGTVALVDGPPVPTPTPVPPPVYSLSGCMVRTQYMLNFRASPGGEIVDILPFDIKLTALERSEGYFKVDYHGAQGWISENLVEPIGTCG